MNAQNPVTYVVTPEGRLIDPASCWAVTLTGEENAFNYAIKSGERISKVVDAFKGGDLEIIYLAPDENPRDLDDNELHKRIKGHAEECECRLCGEGERRYMEWATDTGREPY